MDTFVCLICRKRLPIAEKDERENICMVCQQADTHTLTQLADRHVEDDVDGYNGSWSNAVKTNENKE
jgi:hypothetical protein